MSGPVLYPTQPALLGANSSLLCALYDGQNGATITSYQWVKDGAILTDGGRVSGTTQSTLSVSSVTLQDQGMYQCSAINVDGVSTGLSNSTLVTVGGMYNTIKHWYHSLIFHFARCCGNRTASQTYQCIAWPGGQLQYYCCWNGVCFIPMAVWEWDQYIIRR